MSRNPHLPTDETRKMVRQRAGIGIPQADIAATVRCSEKTLRLYYRDELHEGFQDANAAVLEALMRNVKANNTTAIIFYDKCRGGRKETIKEEISGPQGGPLVFSPITTITASCPDNECDELIERQWRRELGVGYRADNVENDIRRVRQKIKELKANGKK